MYQANLRYMKDYEEYGDDSEDDRDSWQRSTKCDNDLISIPFETVFPEATHISVLIDEPEYNKIQLHITVIAEDKQSQQYHVGGFINPCLVDQTLLIGSSTIISLDESGKDVHVLTFGSDRLAPIITLYDQKSLSLPVTTKRWWIWKWCCCIFVPMGLIYVLWCFMDRLGKR